MASLTEGETFPATAPRIAEPNNTGSLHFVVMTGRPYCQNLPHQWVLTGTAANDDIFIDYAQSGSEFVADHRRCHITRQHTERVNYPDRTPYPARKSQLWHEDRRRGRDYREIPAPHVNLLPAPRHRTVAPFLPGFGRRAIPVMVVRPAELVYLLHQTQDGTTVTDR